MSNILSRIKARNEKLNVIYVPEWGEEREDGQMEPLAIYYMPMTPFDAKQIRQAALTNKHGKDELDLERFACEVLVRKCLDQSKAPLFDANDAKELMRHAEADVINRIVTQITEREDFSDTKKP